MKKFFILILIFFSFHSNAEKIKDAVYLKMSRGGFELINQQLPEIVNGYLKKIDIPNLYFSIPGIGKAIARDIKIGIDLESINLFPQDGYLDIDSILRAFRVDIGNIRVEDYFTGLVGVNCYGTSILLGQNDVFPFSTKLGLKVHNRKLKVDLGNVYFKLRDDQIKTFGPRRCASLLNPNMVFLRIAISKFLKASRPIIYRTLKVVTRTYGVIFNKILSQVFDNFALPLIIPDLFIAPETRLLVSGFPSMIELREEGIKLRLDASLRRGSIEEILKLNSSGVRVLDYASISISPELINDLLGIIFDGKHTQDLELNSDLNEIIDDLLKYGQFSELLPELRDIGTDEDPLKMYLSLKQAPRIEIDPDSPKIRAYIPQLVMRTQVHAEEEWRDFFSFFNDLGIEVEIEKNEDGIKAEVEILHQKVTGKWSPSYSPQDPTFNVDTANEFFPMLFNMLLEVLNEKLTLEIPILNIGGETVTIGDLEVRDGNIHIEISKLPPF